MKRILIPVLAALAVLGLTAPMAQAAKTYRHVVIKPNWSTSTACGSVSTTANLEINNYPVSSTRQAYQIDMDGDTSTTPDVNTYAVYIDGVKQSGTQTFTVYFNDTRTHTIKGTWRFVTCYPYNSITL